MTAVLCGNDVKAYALPRSVTVVAERAFDSTKWMRFVKFNEGLQKLEEMCFTYSGIRKLTLPASVNAIGNIAFFNCAYLRSVDLRAASGITSLGKGAFCQCYSLERALLNDNL